MSVWKVGVFCLLGLGALLLAGCAATPEPEKPFEPPVYPPPPEPPRFIFELSLINSAQVTADAQSAQLRYMLTGEGVAGRGLSKPFDVAVCRGVVYVSDTVDRLVLAFDFVRGRFYEIGLEEPGSLMKPLGLATDASCRLYVADSSLKRVMVYDPEGRFLAGIGKSDSFHRLSHVGVDPAGTRIYAVDTGGVSTDEHRIRVFDAHTGQHLQDIGHRGTGDGELNLPRDIEVGPDGNLYVIDGGNFRVQVFKPDGGFVRAFGKAGAQFGQFSRPKGIAIDSQGNVYVSDTAFGNFQIFTAEGQLLLFVGARGNEAGPGKFLLPAGIDVDEDGRIYFVDQVFRKVDIFRPASLAPNAGQLGHRFDRREG